MFLHDQLAAQRNHEEHAQPAADQSEDENPRVLQIKTEKDEGRQREDDT